MYKSCSKKDVSPLNGKNKCFTHPQKGNKELLRKYCPTLLSPFSGKYLERLLYNSMFEFFM